MRPATMNTVRATALVVESRLDLPSGRSIECQDAEAGGELVTIRGGGHGNFTPEERTNVFLRIRAFLAKAGLL